MINLIVAHTRNNVVGSKGDIPWKLPDDLKRFKTLTTGNTIIMGRKTFESKPLGKPLPNRRNIVVTRNKDFAFNGVEVASSLDEALKMAKGDKEVFVIGGGEIYKQAMPKADKIFATVLQAEIEGDTFFPRVNLQNWQLDKLEKHVDTKSGLEYYYADYSKRDNNPKMYFIDEGRELQQIWEMEDLERRQVCFFCHKHFKNERPGATEFETKYWYVTKNKYPYKHTKLHLLFVAKEHVNSVAGLSPAARKDIGEVIAEIEKRYKLTSYGQFMRAGDFRYNGGTVFHLHGHVIVADHQHPEFQKIKVKLGSRPKD